MRVFDRDLIRGEHYGQRSCEPHSKAEHMAAPTKPANVKIPLANSEPSTHGTERQFAAAQYSFANGGAKRTSGQNAQKDANDPITAVATATIHKRTT